MSERDSDLSEALMHASRALRRRWWAALEGWELSPHQARALRTVCGQEPARLSEIAARLRIAPRSATEVVDSLEARGLVQRTPDPDDRRAVRVVATEAGRQMQETAWAARERAAEEFFGRLEPPEREELGRLLRRLLD
ncbi:MarR family winged helix-turn-helix transcriptional regulator [uncultured Georgenia sp.]|uniref:MarR family winged helix-turn-helix transcriptional regulator n=1 Tax=uncultured Georgenia sp. TaxID=378209 RepID=UPI00262B4FC3|nr:MarR family winged helix-turn-helix transcriptional regulator [uncultured Georgenia sp.]HLV03461.1 MarR family winged helix-turn-helix transcriptional regulator [Actinomycetaceae bacterium]